MHPPVPVSGPTPTTWEWAPPYAGGVTEPDGAAVDPVLLADLSERPRSERWSLRAALVRYAQPQPARAGAVLAVVRRVEAVLHTQLKRIEREAPELEAAMAADDPEPLVQLLLAVRPLDRLGDALAGWAAAGPAAPRPDAELDAVVRDVTARLDELGVPREERTGPPPGARRSG